MSINKQIQLSATVRMDTMNYKGYSGSAHINLNDDLLHGRILKVQDLITYEAKTVRGLKSNFAKAVKEYIATRKQLDQRSLKPNHQ